MTRISARERRLLFSIARTTSLTEFWLGGSVTYHRLARQNGVSFKYADYDLAVASSVYPIHACKIRLQSAGFSIEIDRPYYLKFKLAHQIVARKNRTLVDIAIVEQPQDLGHFNFESILWHFPSGDLLDPHNAVNAMAKGNLYPIITPAEENPYILAGRLAKLCARFDIQFDSDSVLRPFSYELARRINGWQSDDVFQGPYAQESGMASVLQSLLRARNRPDFLRRLHASGLFGAVFPETMECDLNDNARFLLVLAGARTIGDIIDGILECAQSLSSESHEALGKKMKRLGRRRLTGP